MSKKTAWVYLRVSTEEQLSGHSPQTQEQTCRAFAAKLGYTVERVDWEVGTARSMRDRKVWQMYNRALRQHKMDAIIVYAYSRLHRSFMNQVEMLAAAKRAGVDVLSATEYADPTNKGSKLITTMAALFAEIESDTLRQRTMDGTRTRAQLGMPLVGKKPPYGYRWVARHDVSAVTGAGRVRKVALELDPVEAERVRALWAYLDANDRSLADAVSWLNAQGWPSPQGSMWRKTTVRYLLNQPLYWGKAEAFRSEQVEMPTTDERGDVELVKRARPRPAAERIALPPTNAPALVDAGLANRVRARVSARASHRPSTSRLLKRDAYWLRGGLLRCGVCGGSLSPRRRAGRQDFYSCAAGPSHAKGDPRHHALAVNREDAESFAATSIMLLALDSREAEAALRRLADQRNATSSDLAVAEAGLKDVEKRLGRLRKLAEHLTDEEMAEFAEQLAALRRERDGWHQRLAALRGAAHHTESLVSQLVEVVERVRAQLQGLVPAETLSAADAAELERRYQAGEFEAQRVAHAGEWREALQALGAYVVALPAKHNREGWGRLRLKLPLDGPGDGGDGENDDGPRDGPGDSGHSEQLRSGFWPVAVSASQASSTPTISCSA